VTSAVVVIPMLSPLVGGILDTAFGWEAIFILVAAFSCAVLAWAALMLPETRPARAAESPPSRFAADVRALAASARFTGYALCGALAGAVLHLLGGCPMWRSRGGPPRPDTGCGSWFSIGFIFGNLITHAAPPGINRMIWSGILVTIIGALVPTAMCLIDPGVGPVVVFLPQAVISLGNGLLLPTAIAGAVSIRPQVAGTASGLTGCSQMAIGAGAAQLVSHTLAAAATPLPLLLQMLGFGVLTAFAFQLLARHRPSPA
jgi:DHA1 family bicyclomycin/chloramphenicol resistance-like MFS transporter